MIRNRVGSRIRRRICLTGAAFFGWILLFLLASGVLASSRTLADSPFRSAPTLVPPTLLPTQDSGTTDSLLSESALARVQTERKVRVGLLFNAPPFGELDVSGEVNGFDADLARDMAAAWGVDLETVQVTRQTAIDMLRSGIVDMLIAAQVHRRELDQIVEFSQTYLFGSQSMMVRQDDGAAVLADLAGRKVGYVIGTRGAEAVAIWQQRTGLSFIPVQYLTLDQAFSDLVNSLVDAVVDSRVRLLRANTQPGLAKILDEQLSPEPYAIVVRRQDINWRNLINRTLQYLTRKGRLQEIQQAHIPGQRYLIGGIPVWQGVEDDAPALDQYSPDVTFPAQYVIPRIRSAQRLRVAGVVESGPDATESARRVAILNRGLVEALASRWNVEVDFVSDQGVDPADLVAADRADLAVGVTLDWVYSERVDLISPYLLHGERLMARKDDAYETFADLRGRWVGVFAGEAGVEDRVNALASSVSSGVRIFTIGREQDAAGAILDSKSADVVFGDSLKLISHVLAAPDQLRLTRRGNNPDPWYSRFYVGIAVPRNDIDFRLLVEYTLQELAVDGVLASLLQPVLLAEDMPPVDIWPGASDYLGFMLGG